MLDLRSSYAGIDVFSLTEQQLGAASASRFTLRRVPWSSSTWAVWPPLPFDTDRDIERGCDGGQCALELPGFVRFGSRSRPGSGRSFSLSGHCPCTPTRSWAACSSGGGRPGSGGTGCTLPCSVATGRLGRARGRPRFPLRSCSRRAGSCSSGASPREAPQARHGIAAEVSGYESISGHGGSSRNCVPQLELYDVLASNGGA